MRHILLFPVWLLLFLTSFIIGGIMYLWKFEFKTFKDGIAYLNGCIKFMNWYEFSK